MGVKTLAATSSYVYKMGMVSRTVVDALVSKPEPSTFVSPSTSKLASIGITKSILYLGGTTKTVSCSTLKSEIIHPSLHLADASTNMGVNRNK